MELSKERKNEILGILLIVLAIILGIGLFSDLAGIFGKGLKLVFTGLTGNGAYLFPFIFIAFGVALIHSKTLRITPRVVGLIISFFTLLAFLHVLQVPAQDKYFVVALKGQGGGLVGGGLAFLLRSCLGPAGTYVVLSATGLIGLLLLFDIFLAALLTRFTESCRESWQKLTDFFHGMGEKLPGKQKTTEKPKRKSKKTPKKVQALDDEDELENEVEIADEPFFKEFTAVKGRKGRKEVAAAVEVAEEDFSHDAVLLDEPSDEVTSSGTKGSESTAKSNSRRKNSGPYQLPPLKLLTPAPVAKARPEMQDRSQLLEQTLLNFGVQAKTVSVSHGPTITRYELQPAPGVKVSRIVSLADDLALALAASDVRIVAPIPGKAAVGVEVPNTNSTMVKMREIIESDLFTKSKHKLPLALGVDIAGEPVVADLVAMPHLLVAGSTGSGKSVCINTIILSLLYRARPDEVKILLVDPKKVEMAVYRDMPHLMAPVVTDAKKASAVLKLVVQEMERRYDIFANSGTRGIEDYNILVGKRQEIRAQAIARRNAEAAAQGLNSTDIGIGNAAGIGNAVGNSNANASVTDSATGQNGGVSSGAGFPGVSGIGAAADGATTLGSAAAQKLDNGATQIPLTPDEDAGDANIPEDCQPMPYIVVIIDELADLMMVAANDVEESICRLAQMARAAGIHLIIATQRPSVDVITGLIKANVPSRIAFAVSSQIDSRTILDLAGAEKLLGKGDMLFSPVGANKMRRVQGAFVSTEEVTQVVEFVKKGGEPEYASLVEQLESSETVEADDEEKDDLYEEAVKIVVSSSPSISTLQRRLKIGYARAARLIDTMEREGIVGPYAGSKPRELLVSEEEIETILRKR